MNTLKQAILYAAVLLLVSQLFATRLSAQMVDSTAYVSISSNLQQPSHGDGKVVIKQSSAITKLLENNALYNQRNQSMVGWRIIIYRGNVQNARSISNAIMVEFKSRYPYVGTYLSYDPPDFVVSVGDFRTIDDAEFFIRKLKSEYKDYPKARIVKKDKINFPSL